MHIALNHQYDLMTNIDVEDGLINGAECCVKYITENKNNQNLPSIIWVIFEDSKIGIHHRKKYKLLYNTNILSSWTPIFPVKRAYKVQSVWVHRVQFPLRQAAARTIHVAQSSTYKKIFIDMSTSVSPPKNWWHHMHYVALSRVTSLSGLYIRNLNETKISVSSDVLGYINNARKKSTLNISYQPTYNFD